MKEDHDFEKMTAAQYIFVKKRMQADVLSTNIKTAELLESLKQKQGIHEGEVEKCRKAK